MPPTILIRPLSVAAALLTALVLWAAPAHADEEVAFTGAGWGHGIGMTQYGARALADAAGYSAAQITGYYYTGTAVQDAAAVTSFPNPLWIGLQQDQTVVDFRPLGGPVTLCQAGDGEGPCPKQSAQPQAGELWRFEVTGLNQCQFSRFDGAAFLPVGNPGECRAAFTWEDQPNVKIELPNINRTYARGTAIRIRPAPDNTFHVALEIDLEQYLYGLGEVPSSWSAAVLQAQAIAGRSYAVYRAKIWEPVPNPATVDPEIPGGRKDACFCHLYASTLDQAYVGWVKENPGNPHAVNWVNAVNATAGQVITHPAHGVIGAFYSSSSGGRTENNEDLWGGDPLPYLRSVDDSWSLHSAAQNPLASWTRTRTRSAVGASVGIDQLAEISVTERYASGSAKTVRFHGLDAEGEWRTVAKAGWWVRNALDLPSGYFDVSASFPVTPKALPLDSVALHDPQTGLWHLRRSDGGIDSFYFGNPADIPYTGDWNGDGITTLGLYRRSTGFLFLRNSNTQGIADIEIYYGNPDDLPIAGDWDGDGIDTVGIFRPSEGTFYLRNTNTQGVADIQFSLGDSGDVPIAGDWNGDGMDTVGVWRPSAKKVFLTNGHDAVVDFVFDYTGAAPGDRIVVGDWDGDGVDTLGVFRPADGAFYLRDTYTQSSANLVIPMGDPHMSPVAGSWGS